MKRAVTYLEQVIAAARSVDLDIVEQFIELLANCYAASRTVLVIGNGGSASNASHLAQDLSKGSIPDLEGKRFRVLSLADNVSFLTSVANDLGYDRVFEVQLRQFASPGDLLIAISGSGNSPNIVRAAQYAKSAGITLAGITGFDGGVLRKMSDICLHVPIQDMCKAEAVHSILMHLISDLLRERLAAGK